MIVGLGILIDDADLDAESEPFVKDAGYDIDIKACYCLLGLSYILVITSPTFLKITTGMCKRLCFRYWSFILILKMLGVKRAVQSILDSNELERWN